MNIIKIIKLLKKAYPDSKCSLDFKSPFEMAVAVILSAQCTDERVNKITPDLFKKYSSIEAFANSDIDELESLIHSCGFYKNKAKNIKLCAQKLITDFNSELPNSMDILVTLPGVGRKSANVIMLEVFNNPCGIAVDTHAKRISNRLGLSLNSAPEKIEQDLLKIIPKKYYYDINHLFVWHGRYCCHSRNPNCKECPILCFCKSSEI